MNLPTIKVTTRHYLIERRTAIMQMPKWIVKTRWLKKNVGQVVIPPMDWEPAFYFFGADGKRVEQPSWKEEVMDIIQEHFYYDLKVLQNRIHEPLGV